MYSLQEPITIFTVPKPFEGHNGLIQTNAITSWTRLRPRPQIILFGDEKGIAEIAEKLNVIHVPHIKLNEHGTPLLDSVFSQAQELAKGSILTYVNADIILLNDLLVSLQKLQTASFNQFLMVGKRLDVDVTKPIDFDTPGWDKKLSHFALETGKFASVVCRDYFVFPKPLYAEIPPFAVGRGHWDSWMVYHAHKLKVPVVDATGMVTAIHQNHNYTHMSNQANRGIAYVKGKEAQRNAKLAGGMHVVKGASMSWKLTPSGPKRQLLPVMSFILDLPRYIKLLAKLFLPDISMVRRTLNL